MISRTKRFKKGSSLQTIFFSTLIGMIFLVTIGFLIFSNFKISQKRAELISQIEILTEKIQALKERNQELEAEISQTSEKSYLEKVARNQLGLQQPGEEVVAIIKEKKEEKEIKEEKSFWQKFLEKMGI